MYLIQTVGCSLAEINAAARWVVEGGLGLHPGPQYSTKIQISGLISSQKRIYLEQNPSWKVKARYSVNYLSKPIIISRG